jgi:hypothetical protein
VQVAFIHPDETGESTGMWTYDCDPRETIEDIADGLGISPDEKVWTVDDPGPVEASFTLPDGRIVVGRRPSR